MKIYVTKKDIKLGAPSRLDSCPISLAIKRRLKGKVDVYTYCHVVYIHNKTEVGYRRFELPKKATAFVDAFDGGKSVKPFRFTLT